MRSVRTVRDGGGFARALGLGGVECIRTYDKSREKDGTAMNRLHIASASTGRIYSYKTLIRQILCLDKTEKHT